MSLLSAKKRHLAIQKCVAVVSKMAESVSEGTSIGRQVDTAALHLQYAQTAAAFARAAAELSYITEPGETTF